MIKNLQLYLFCLFLFLLSKKTKIIAFLLSVCFISLSLIITLYDAYTLTLIDYYFFKKNISDAFIVIGEFKIIFIIILIISLIISAYLLIISKIISKLKILKKIEYSNFIFFILILFLFFFPSRYSDFSFNFMRSIFIQDKVIENYENNYEAKFINLSKEKTNYLSKIKTQENLPKYLDNIIFLQLESINSELINPEISPNLYELSKKGYFFPRFYGNSTQTIFGQENILCSLPSSFYLNLAQKGRDKSLACLPEIFNRLNYKTLFYKTFNLDFTQTGDFMKNIGFKEVHADDIMSNEDPQYWWGYREDIFYEKALNDISHKIEKNNFIYLEVGPTNHWPFNTPTDIEIKVPYPNPKNHNENISNTTFIQDYYLKIALDKINKIFPENNYSLFVLGDHAWPIELHENNFFNQQNSYEENFLTTLVIKFGNEEGGKIINERFSHLDIYPTIMELFNLPSQESIFGQSFSSVLNDKDIKIEHEPIILIQPYDEKYLNFIEFPIKYQYNSTKKTLVKYNLEKDPNEFAPTLISKDKDIIIKTINGLLNKIN